jgi:hypothetical protein
MSVQIREPNYIKTCPLVLQRYVRTDGQIHHLIIRGKLVQAITLLSYMQGVLGSTLGRDTVYPDQEISCFFSVEPG